MRPPNPPSESPQPTLPLFRPEALEAQEQKFYGDILLIRPLSLVLLFWLGIGISATVLGFLLVGKYTERVRIYGVVAPDTQMKAQAELFVPEPDLRFIRRGQLIPVHCQSCPAQQSQPQISSGSVIEISQTALAADHVPAELRTDSRQAIYAVKISLPDAEAELPPATRLEADLAGARKPLLKWLFER